MLLNATEKAMKRNEAATQGYVAGPGNVELRDSGQALEDKSCRNPFM